MKTRRLALEVLSDVLDNGAYANLCLNRVSADLNDNDSRFLSVLVYTTLEHLLYLDYMLHAFAPQRQKRVVMHILRLGVCELLYMRTPAHAAVSEYVELCKSIGKGAVSGFVNALLRRVDRERNDLPEISGSIPDRLSIHFSYPKWIVEMWLQERGENETERLLSLAPSPTCVRAQYPATTETVLSALTCKTRIGSMDPHAVHLESAYDISNWSLLKEGKATVQGEGAMTACLALGDVRNKKILDACAAPGGKSAYISSLSENTAQLVCFELHEHRCELMKKTFSRLGVTAQIEQQDASVFCTEREHVFDIVLLDVPCSGLGLLAGKPDLRYNKSREDIEQLVQIQKELLETCSKYVKKDGLLVYSTCTISRRENEQQVAAFLQRHSDFVPDCLPFHGSHEIQLLPHIHGTEGFYIARMKRCI